ncbi:MAG: hypothetical protein ABIW85_02810 [Variovorax sp.]
MDKPSILDRDSLLGDLRLASGYASRAGLLRDGQLIDRMEAVEQSINADGRPNAYALTLALNDLAQAIAPMTLADLRCGRDPFERANQRRARVLQLGLAILALITMVLIGHSMSALGTEKAGLQAMQQLQSMQPMQKITALRKMAQFDDPLRKRDSSSDLYYQRIGEWVAMYETRELIDTKMANARDTSMWPWQTLLARFLNRSATANVASAMSQQTDAEAAEAPAAAASAALATAADGPVQPRDPVDAFCRRGADGTFELPAALKDRPDWLKNLQADSINDFCFQYEVLRPITGGLNLPNQNIARVGNIPDIEFKVTMRSNWFLPFYFGVLGAIIFVMRNIANIRTPAMELFPMVMRISLGGVAGIVIGWFSTAALPAIESTSALSVPFALAFLTGYAIDALFGVLDRMSRVTVAGPTQKPAAAG